MPLKVCQSEMPWIGPGIGSGATPHRVKLPNQLGITEPGVGGGDLFDVVVSPQTIGITKSRNATLGAYTGARQHKQSIDR